MTKKLVSVTILGILSLTSIANAATTYYEVWRNTTDDPDTAVRIAEWLTDTYYNDDDPSLDSGQHYFYWIRALACEAIGGSRTYPSGVTLISAVQCPIATTIGCESTLEVTAYIRNNSLFNLESPGGTVSCRVKEEDPYFNDTLYGPWYVENVSVNNYPLTGPEEWTEKWTKDVVLSLNSDEGDDYLEVYSHMEYNGMASPYDDLYSYSPTISVHMRNTSDPGPTWDHVSPGGAYANRIYLQWNPTTNVCSEINLNTSSAESWTTPAIPSSPSLSSPSNGSTVNGTTIEFRWNASSGADNYYLQVATDSLFNNTIYDDEVGNCIDVDMSGMPDNGTRFYWRVKAENISGWSGYSNAWYFNNGTTPPPCTLSGYIQTFGGAGVPASLHPDSGGYYPADSAGYYECVVPYGWSGRVWVVLSIAEILNGLIVSPSYRDYVNVETNYYNQNYTGTYTVSALTVTIHPAELRSSAMWRLTSGSDTNWKQSGDTVYDVPIGTGSLEFKDIAGFAEPSPRTIEIAQGENTESGTYQVIYSGGAGTENDPFIIASVDDLLNMSENPASYDKHFILTENIDLADYIFSNSLIWGFSGVFDGNGKKITNLVISQNLMCGFFGLISSGGEVNNLGIENCSINGLGYVGGLVANNNGGSINTCYVSGHVNATSVYAGGLVGLNSGNISNCYASVSVSGSGEVGGLVGYNSGSISNSYSTGAISGDGNLGGLVGLDEGTISNSFWDTETSGIVGGMGLTTSQMQDMSTFVGAGWDFNDLDGNPAVWKMRDGFGYPLLSWQEYLKGDFAGDYSVNLIDFSVFAASWRSQFGDSNFNIDCDLDNSGDSNDVIDLADLMVFCENWLAHRATIPATFVAPYNGSSPTIDGVLSDGEWGSSYTVTMDRRDGDGQHDIDLYFQYDGTYLFIGVDSQWESGWDVVWDIGIDGDHSRTFNGNLSQPYTDIDICQQSPSGYSGYKAYYTIISDISYVRVGYDSGASSASSGSTNVSYEFRIPLADLDVVPGDSVGIWISHGYDGITEHLYELSSTGSRTTPENWATLQIVP